MPPRQPISRKRPQKGYDPTASIAAAAEARRTAAPNEEIVNNPEQSQETPPKGGNDDLKKLIETLKSKMQTKSSLPQKKVPPKPQAKWNRSIEPNKKSTWSPTPAYTVLTRISNHEKVPTQLQKQQDVTVKSVPHSFIYRPGADGITVGKLNIKSGKQLSWG
ncbi:MAG: hypothetical protein HYR97_03880 [Candidatus Melainabacteria bacterium]|nr:hypothetical protein [Candidatus Melainabacteria bacterium]MBI3308783.1 hypothetical protein [Candidatus Melainabacteria bacterium]